MTTALPNFVQCKRAQAAPPAAKPPASAAVSGLVGALVGAGLLGGERLINGKKDPHASKDPAARRREVLKRALLGGLIGGAGGAVYGHERRPGGRLSLQDAGPKKPGNAIPAVPATLIGAILGAGALGGGRAITRAMDPAESEDLEEGGDSVWRRALLGAGLGGAAGYGVSWNTRPGGVWDFRAPNTPTNDVIPAAGTPERAKFEATLPADSPLRAQLDKVKAQEALIAANQDPAGPNSAAFGAAAGLVAPRAVYAAGRAAKDLVRTRSGAAPELAAIFRKNNVSANPALYPNANKFLAHLATNNATSSSAIRNVLSSMEVTDKGVGAKLLAEAQAIRPNVTLNPKGGPVKSALRSLLGIVWKESDPAGSAARNNWKGLRPSWGTGPQQKARPGILMSLASGLVGGVAGASNDIAAAEREAALRATMGASQ